MKSNRLVVTVRAEDDFVEKVINKTCKQLLMAIEDAFGMPIYQWTNAERHAAHNKIEYLRNSITRIH